MPDFFDNSVLGIKRNASRDGGQTETCDVILPNGDVVATMRIFIPELKYRILRALNLKFVYPLKAEILAPNNKVLLRIDKPFSTKDYVATLQDESRRVLGKVLRVPLSTGVGGGAWDYKVNDASNNLVGLMRGNWRLSSQLQIMDERGGVLGKVTRRDPAMGPGRAMDNTFHVVNCYAPPQSADKRLALLGAAAAIDLLCD